MVSQYRYRYRKIFTLKISQYRYRYPILWVSQYRYRNPIFSIAAQLW